MQVLDSLHSQPDFAHRTADFFDDTSEDDSAHALDSGRDAPALGLISKRDSRLKRRQRAPTSELFRSQCEGSKGTAHLDEGSYQRLAPNAQKDGDRTFANTPGTSYNGSIDELLPGERSSTPPFLRLAQTPLSGTPRETAQSVHLDSHMSMPPNMHDQKLAAHAIAHEITLQALMRDGTALDGSLPSLAPLTPGHRASLLPAVLQFNDPRSPRNPTPSSLQNSHSKKVHVLPPPIDTSAPRRTLPANLVRTPYPLPSGEVHRKDFGQATPSVALGTPSVMDSTLTVSIRRRNSHSTRRITSLAIPAATDYTTMEDNSLGWTKRQSKAIEFDDSEFFRQLRRCYRELGGPLHFLGARSLKRIAVSGRASKAADAGYGWLHQPRSPRLLQYRGLTDTFSEEKILEHYRRPQMGRSRYAFVHWAHRLAAVPPVQTPQTETDGREPLDCHLTRREEQPEGLEFILGWSIPRVVFAFALVGSLNVAAPLLWIFLGQNTPATLPPQGGFRDAGDRVGTGLILGVGVLLLGVSSVAGWLGVSWLVM